MGVHIGVTNSELTTSRQFHVLVLVRLGARVVLEPLLGS